MANTFDPLLEILDGNFTARWNFPLAVGTLITAPGGIGSAVNLTYSYLNSSASEPTFAPLTAGQKAAAEMAIASFESVAGISLVEVSNGGQISFGTNAQSGTAGYASYPGYGWSSDSFGLISSVFEISSAGDVWLSNTEAWAPNAFLPGGYGLHALLHEIGHAMGLKHPFEGAFQLSPLENTKQYTVMAYNPHPHSLFRTVTMTGGGGYQVFYQYVSQDSLMPLDILALQYLYGANTSFNSGDTIYSFDPNQPFIRTIWDGGGTDTISLANFSNGSRIDLEPGSFSSVRINLGATPIGFVETHADLYNGTDNLAIAFGTSIENATGGIGSDSLSGNALNNLLTGGNGNDTIDGRGLDDVLKGDAGNDSLNGGAGYDTAVFSGVKAGYVVTRGIGSVTVSGADGVDVLTGIEKLQFSDGNTFLGGGGPDFNGDGVGDLLWRNNTLGADVIWRGASSASTQAVVTVADPNWKILGASDFNGDGVSDILWRNSASGANVVWRGADSAQTQAVVSVGDLNFKVAGVGDFNGDGAADILWRNTATGANVIWNSANAATAQSVTSVSDQSWKVAGIGDFNGDGVSDMLWRNAGSGANVIWRGANSAATQGVVTVDLTWTVAGVGDFNGDGTSDILWRNTSGVNVIWRGANSATTQAVTTVDQTWQISGTSDYNGDGTADLLWRNTGSGINVIWQGANSATTQAVTTVDTSWSLPAQTNTWSSGSGLNMDFDFNGDAKSDVLWRNTATGANVIWQGANNLTTQSVTSVGDLTWKVAGLADFNGDGKDDILWRNSASGANVVWKGGDSAQTQAVVNVGDLNFKVAGIGDFNGDGTADILWRNTSTGADVIWNSANAATTQAVTTVSDQTWKVAGIGDFNGDGKDDLLWRNFTSGADVIWLNGNSAATQAVTSVSVDWLVAGIGDFNGDAKDDILWRNTTTGANVIWNAGNSATTQAVTSVGDLAFKVVGTGDYNGDGKADIAWRHATSGADTIWNGANSATLLTLIGVSDTNWSLPEQTNTWVNAAGNYAV